MNSFKNNNDEKWLDDLLGKSIGSEKAEPDFEKWRQKHPQAVEMLISRANRQYSASICPLGIWRIIMKSPITKLAAAAVIIAVVLSITLMDKSMSPAYALEQTMKAYDGIRFVHIKHFKEGESEPQEFWVQYDDNEVKKIRCYSPKWSEPKEGPLTMVWNNGKMEVLGKDERGNQTVVIRNNEKSGEEMLRMLREADPKSKIQELHQLETEGKIKINTSKPALSSEPIVITANFPPDSEDASGRLILYVDQNTKLVSRIIFNKVKERDGNQHSWEFSDYNIAVDENLFTLKEAGENVQRYYETAKYNPTEIGLAQGKLGDDEIAVELARQFIQAIIDKDYEKAGKLCGGTPQSFGEILYKKILRIEPPTKPVNCSTQALNVPCVVAAKFSKNPTLLVIRKNIRVEPYIDEPNIWVVDRNDNERPVMTADPTDTTSTFLKNINSKLASLNINKSTADDVIAVLGEPWAYRFEDKDLEKNNLPEVYVMDYPGSFIVSIYKNQVMEWGSQQIPGHEIPGYIFSDSIQIGTTLDEVLKELGPPAKIVEGIELPNHKTKNLLFEDNAIYENMNINERKGFCFWTNSNGGKVRIYFDDNVLYQNMNKTRGNCFYGTISEGKRIRLTFVDNKVFSLHEYRTEPIKNIE